MDSKCISNRNEFTGLPKNNVRPKSWSPIHITGRVSSIFKDITSEFLRKVTKKHSHGAYRVSPLPEEENVDLNSNDSSYTMRGSTSLPSANAVGKCSNLGLTSGFFKDITSEFLRKVTKKHSHGAYRVSPLPEEENVDLMTVSTSLACANAVGKWHELDTTSCGFSKDITSELLGEATKKHLHGANGVSPLPEEENVDLNSDDSSSTMRVSTSLPKANIAGKCSNLGLKLGFLKDLHGANRVSPLPEEENRDLNSNDSSSTMRVSTSLPKANIAGKCSNLRLTRGFLKIPVEEEMALHSYEPPKIIVLSSRPLAGPSIFNCSGLSDSIIPSSSNSSSVWILDSGAACHVCYSRASFEPFIPTFNSFITLPNGHTVPVGGTGSVRLCDDLTLQNVLFVPQFHCNVLSISALTQQLPYG